MVRGHIRFNKSRPPLIGSWPPREVIGVPTSAIQSLSPTLLIQVGPSTYRTYPSSPLPSLAKSFPPASASLMLQSLQHGSHAPRNVYLRLVAIYFASVLRLMYESACSPGPLLSLMSPSLLSPQHKCLCSLSTIVLGSALVASLLLTLTDGLPVLLFFPLCLWASGPRSIIWHAATSCMQDAVLDLAVSIRSQEHHPACCH